MFTESYVATLGNIVLVGYLVLSASAATSADQDGYIDLTFDNGICLSAKTTAREVVEVHTVKRLTLEATSFQIALQSAVKPGWLSLKTPNFNRADSNATHFGQCHFVEGVAGFLRQSDVNYGGCRPVIGKAYHSMPGSQDNIVVRCLELQETNCSISLIETVDSIDVRVSYSVKDQPPASWMAIANDLRRFVAMHVTPGTQC